MDQNTLIAVIAGAVIVGAVLGFVGVLLYRRFIKRSGGK